MSKNKKDKSPFVGYTVQEVLYAESVTFYIRVGIDFYVHNGKMTFNYKAAVSHYNKILNELVRAITVGTAKQRKNALFCLETLQILPLRLS
jgi:hypothetical protein